MNKFIHICPDEKFISAAISQFTEVDKENHLFIIISKKKKLDFLKDERYIILTPLKLYFYMILNFNELKNKIIVLHSAKKYSKIATLLSPSKCKIVWIGFGYDYYNEPSPKKHKKYIEKAFLKRIDFFSPVLTNEIKIVKSKYPYFKAKLLDWNYDVVSFFWKKDIPKMSDSILLGNSATETNNHFEIITLLNKIKEKKKIILPLSYGSHLYKDKILDILNQSNLNTQPLLDYINIEDYYNIISGCSHVIMNHDRQQAYGNIMILLYSGSKLFLKKQNPLYTYLSESGFIIYTIDELQYEIKSRLTKECIMHNRELALSLYSRINFLNRTRRFIKTIEKND
ncbi:TDP-N-acetylfucosamine:lipid II N-acetylfucosaminyltransferase [Proteus mirabilis]|uniref:TDP-N-acetylfucosamine:lipid II N-acetylfucosaminyltransferase n=1 Tax=Proteus mirabilis TaxID=584 RepID=UPI00197FD6F7|nr:TDP-N-acetylfucosamine:lipid II N-acetylfucosaminyltransferase [Proteus mirabilis]QSI20397.1 hypothetical protein GJR68_00310 [Proteus mirabilis]QUY06545.1 TDP-N-acetylfucosamine:lipid II N-acetylfucosaminyltransferase [Proteus mirabilis]